MDANRRAALSAGVLFITATAANVAGTSLSRSLLDGADYLTQVAANTNRVTAGALLELVAAGACAGIAIAMYPVLKNRSSGLALGSVIFRTMEALMYSVAVVGLLSVLALGRGYPQAGLTDRAPVQATADALLDLREQAGLVAVLAFGVGALMYYTVFYRSRLLPRWLSGWGILAIVLMIAVWLVALVNHRPMTTYTVLLLPIAVQEMVLAVWLIVRGFSSPGRRSGAVPGTGTATPVTVPSARP
jgi:Domain of unknown function (DUF4386)